MGKVEAVVEWVPYPDDMYSDDSSFIGDEKTTAEYGKRAASFNPRDFWGIHDWNMQCLAAQEKASLTQPVQQGIKRKREDPPTIKLEDGSKSAKLKHESTPTKPKQTAPASTASPEPFNPYADQESAYQLHETIEEFVNRLRPSESTIATVGPWIWISNPHSTSHRHDADVGGFKQCGFDLLESFMRMRKEFEDQNPDKIPSSITRMLKPERDQLEADIVKLAKERKVTCGKWMLFTLPKDVDAVWSKVCRGTVEGRLGCSAKVATDDGNDQKPERLVCVYTDDFSDKDDVKRVLAEMKEMGLVKNDKAIYYKCDAYTYLDIISGNDYKIKASMYDSRDVFKGMGSKKR